jgi:putative transposase
VARPLRDTAPGIFHVFTHSVWAADALYRDDEDRERFLSELSHATTKMGWTCLAYCLMGTHYHLLLAVEAGVLPRGMHSLNFRYAGWFNRRHAMKGHVHGTRFNARRVNGEADLLWRYRYVVRNPVEAGLCERAEDWRWSSYAATLGLAKQRPFVNDSLVIACLEGPRPSAAPRLQHFVENT